MGTGITVIVLLLALAVVAGVLFYSNSRKGNLTRELQQMQQQHLKELEMVSRSARESAEAQNRQLLAEVKALSQQLAVEQSDRIRHESSIQMKAVVEPLKQNLESFGKLVRESYDRENTARSSLSGQLEQLMALNRSIGDEARQLTNALKGDSKVQGDWGESQLTTLLEHAGLQPDIHFKAQVTRDETGKILRNEEGGLQRPDVVIYLPQGKQLIVDSKVSLTAFVAYNAAENEEERRRQARKHTESVRRHIKELAAKNYPASLKGACDQTLMFMPLEGALMLAIRMDPELLQYAASVHVAIVSPLHLYSVVQLAAQIWRQDAQDHNALEIAEAGGRLYDKLAGFCATFEKTGETLNRALAQWEEARKQLSTGRGNVLTRAEKLRSLGAKATKRLPQSYEEDEFPDQPYSE